MCLKLQDKMYFTPLVAAMEVCNASRGSVAGIAFAAIKAAAS